MRMPMLTVIILSWFVSPFIPVMAGQNKGDDGEAVPLMEQKLSHAQSILSAIAREDYAKLADHADQLRKLAEKQWIEKETPEYRAQLKDFWVVLEGIRASAEEKDIDQATVAYMQMTLSCVKCHKYLRKNPL